DERVQLSRGQDRASDECLALPPRVLPVELDRQVGVLSEQRGAERQKPVVADLLETPDRAGLEKRLARSLACLAPGRGSEGDGGTVLDRGFRQERHVRRLGDETQGGVGGAHLEPDAGDLEDEGTGAVSWHCGNTLPGWSRISGSDQPDRRLHCFCTRREPPRRAPVSR